jgi:outer membrane receptor protein involved in Fe transport
MAYSPTRNLATGGTIYDRSKKFSTQLQQSNEFFDGNLRFVWGIDYFMTMPDTRGTILRDKNGNDRRDNDGDGEAGSPNTFGDQNDNTWYDIGERYNTWATIETDENGQPIDNVLGAIKDGIDNDGDGLIDEGIDENDEDNRRIVNELGAYYQVNWKLSDKFELVQATRWDAHDRLTDMINFDNERGRNINFLNWEFDFDNTEGLQISPKVGLIYRPKENQTFRLTWAQAFNTPANHHLFLDIFVTRVAIFKVYARGADGGYIYPRGEDGQPYYYNVDTFEYAPLDTSQYILFYPSIDPKIEGFYNYTTKDIPEIDAEVINTWEVGWKGRINRKMFGTLDIFTNHFNNFISRPTFISPIVVNKYILESDWDNDGIINDVVDIANNNLIADQEDYDISFDKWRDNIVGVTAMDTIKGSAPPIVVGYLNYGVVDVRGLDASITYFFNRSLSFDLHYSYLNISDFLNPITNSKDPINAPKNKGGFKIQYEPRDKPYSFSLNFRHVDGFQWSSGIYFGQINSYNIFDLHADYEINNNLSAMLTLNNMLDNMHTEIQGGPQLGRVIMFRLQAKF